ISNWSTKDQASLITQSETDGIGTAVPRESLTGDMALLKLDELHFSAFVASTGVEGEEGYIAEIPEGQFYGDVDYECFDDTTIHDELDTLVWTDEPSEGGEI
ncbi:hypothetical protein N8148_03115, partial [Gammaproteobacteria bacterium]|nr:hypothetical protein [Gammaproteobacteria bacterium]